MDRFNDRPARPDSGLDIGPIITHRFAIDAFADVFATLVRGVGGEIIRNGEATP